MPEQHGKPKVSVVDRRHWVDKKEGGDEAEAPSRLPTYIEQLEARARAQEEKLNEFVEKQQAENEAFRERIRKEADRNAEQSLSGLVEELVGALDDMDRALASGENSSDATAVLEGIRMVRSRLGSTLESHGLERVSGAGGPFDPNVHEAVATVPVADPAQENQVADEVLPGYLLNGRLLRPARVRVGKLARPPQADPQQAETPSGGAENPDATE
jgi:molecular chaperone GrpE